MGCRGMLVVLFITIRTRLAMRIKVSQNGPGSEKVCKVEEKQGHTHYGVSFSYPQEEVGCSDLKCNPFSFMSEAVPKLIKHELSDDGKVCSCHTAVPIDGNPIHLFDYYISASLTDNKVCSPQNCWNQYSDMLFMAKQLEVSSISITNQLKRPDHWDMGCGFASEAVPIGLRDLGSLVRDMSSKGGKHARAAKQIAGRVKLDNIVEAPLVNPVSEKVVLSGESNDDSVELKDHDETNVDVNRGQSPKKTKVTEPVGDSSTIGKDLPTDQEVDGHTGTIAATKTSDTTDTARNCAESIDKLALFSHGLIVEFTEQCSVSFDDFDGETLTKEGLEKMCGNHDCLKKEAFAVAPTGFEDLTQQCIDAVSKEHLDMLGPAFRIASNLHAAWISCDRDVHENVTSSNAPQECPSPSTVSLDCGWPGITPEECSGEGCCWEPSSRKGRNWCYRKQSQVTCEKKCPVEHLWQPAHREDCQPFLILDQFTDPNPVIRGNACARVGCCWDELTEGSKEPWCFYQPCLA